VPEEKWGGTMALFVGYHWWTDGERILAELEAAVQQLAEAASDSQGIAQATSWTPSQKHSGGPAAIELFERFGVASVAGAGLLDGINPCAAATLVFIISYLSFLKKGAHGVLAAGLSFVVGIFLAYLALAWAPSSNCIKPSPQAEHFATASVVDGEALLGPGFVISDREEVRKRVKKHR